MFFWNSCFFDDPADIGNLISGSSDFSKTSLNIWKFMVYILLKPGLENLEHYFTSVWEECNCVVVWAFFGIAFLRDWNENGPFLVLWPLLSFPNLLAYWVQHFLKFPKANLTSHSRISGSRSVTTATWLSRSLWTFLYSSLVYSCHLFLISCTSIRSLPFSVLYCAHPCVKHSLGISNFLKSCLEITTSYTILLTSVYSSSGPLSIRSCLLNLFITSAV